MERRKAKTEIGEPARDKRLWLMELKNHHKALTQPPETTATTATTTMVPDPDDSESKLRIEATMTTRNGSAPCARSVARRIGRGAGERFHQSDRKRPKATK
jgi:hypothetical protein